MKTDLFFSPFFVKDFQLGHFCNEHKHKFNNDCAQVSVLDSRLNAPSRRSRPFSLKGMLLHPLRSTESLEGWTVVALK